MAAFEKVTVVLENLHGNISVYLFQKLFLPFFVCGDINITLLIGGTCTFSFQYTFQIKHGILQKDFLRNRLIIAS